MVGDLAPGPAGCQWLEVVSVALAAAVGEGFASVRGGVEEVPRNLLAARTNRFWEVTGESQTWWRFGCCWYLPGCNGCWLRCCTFLRFDRKLFDKEIIEDNITPSSTPLPALNANLWETEMEQTFCDKDQNYGRNYFGWQSTKWQGSPNLFRFWPLSLREFCYPKYFNPCYPKIILTLVISKLVPHITFHFLSHLELL